MKSAAIKAALLRIVSNGLWCLFWKTSYYKPAGYVVLVLYELCSLVSVRNKV